MRAVIGSFFVPIINIGEKVVLKIRTKLDTLGKEFQGDTEMYFYRGTEINCIPRINLNKNKPIKNI